MFAVSATFASCGLFGKEEEEEEEQPQEQAKVQTGRIEGGGGIY